MLSNFENMSSLPSSKVNFFSDGVKANIKNRRKLKAFIESIFKVEKKEIESLNYIFCSDKALREINNKYLKHNYFTDIVTFALSDKGQPVMSEVYISIDRVKANARKFGVSDNMELHRVVFHGALHLCGYNDKGQKEKKKMRLKEDLYLTKYFRQCFT